MEVTDYEYDMTPVTVIVAIGPVPFADIIQPIDKYVCSSTILYVTSTILANKSSFMDIFEIIMEI